METITYELPAMYGDHHVIEVRKILGEIPGVEDIYASSAFQAVEVKFDPEKVSEEQIEKKLDEAGYLGELELPVEADAATYLEEDRSESFFRHTEVFETSKQVVSFAQNVNYSGRPLWNCPGIGVIKSEMED
ncbi:MAG: heavy-metal-associated domain-containing protein [Anaerolineales bacterium]|jgi:copper chaperone CopZ